MGVATLQPLSFTQERTLQDTFGGWTNVGSVVALRFTEVAGPDRVIAALDRVVARHEAFRLRFHATTEGWRQELGPATLPAIEHVRLRGGAHEEELKRLVVQAVDTPIAAFDELPWRVRLIESSPDDYALVLVMSHAICDGGSSRRLAVELAECFHAGPDAAPAAPPAGSSVEHAIAQRRRERQPLTPFWRAYLAAREQGQADAPLGDAAPGSALDAFGMASAKVLDAAQTTRLQERARAAGASIDMALLATCAFACTPSGCGEVALEALHENRFTPAFRDTIGDFAESLPFRVSVAGRPSFETLLHRVRSAWLEALQNRMPHALLRSLQLADADGPPPTLSDLEVNIIRHVPLGESPAGRVERLETLYEERHMRVCGWGASGRAHHGVRFCLDEDGGLSLAGYRLLGPPDAVQADAEALVERLGELVADVADGALPAP